MVHIIVILHSSFNDFNFFVSIVSNWKRFWVTWTFAEISKVEQRGYVGLITKMMSNQPCMHEAMILSIGLS